jgi:putative salt-induced outer membrane protein YdiY
MSISLRPASILAATVLIVSGSALASDTANSREAAIARLEAAQQALEAAQAELAAAQTEAAMYAEATSSVAKSKTTTKATNTTSDQPEGNAEDASEAAQDLAWNEGWDYSFSAGISGASGNNENFAGRVTLGGERLTEAMETRGHASYLYSTSEGQRSASRGEIGLKNDWLLDGPWRYFAQGLYEYDEFQAYQHRLSGAVGVGYEFINNDTTTLIGRVGVGGSYEFGKNADEKLVPEGLLGLDWTHKLSANTKLTASTTYYPSFDDFGEFRWVNSAGIEVLLDAETGMTMNAGIEHRHDSTPGTGIKPNDVDYYMGVGWKF